MQFLAQATLLTQFFVNSQPSDEGHDDVFREFADTLIALLETPQPKARIRAMPCL